MLRGKLAVCSLACHCNGGLKQSKLARWTARVAKEAWLHHKALEVERERHHHGNVV